MLKDVSGPTVLEGREVTSVSKVIEGRLIITDEVFTDRQFLRHQKCENIMKYFTKFLSGTFTSVFVTKFRRRLTCRLSDSNEKRKSFKNYHD